MNLERSFLNEADELLNRIGEDILDFENKPDDEELLNKIYRAAHTLKGSANLFGYTGIATITHLLESVLDDLRMGDRFIDPVLVDLLLESFDQIKGLVTMLEDGIDDPQSEPEILHRLERLVENRKEWQEVKDKLELPPIEWDQWAGMIRESMEGIDFVDIPAYLVEPESLMEHESEGTWIDFSKELSQVHQDVDGLLINEVIDEATVERLDQLYLTLLPVVKQASYQVREDYALRNLLTIVVIVQNYIKRLATPQKTPSWWQELWNSWKTSFEQLASGGHTCAFTDLVLDVWELCSIQVEVEPVFGVLFSPPVQEEEGKEIELSMAEQSAASATTGTATSATTIATSGIPSSYKNGNTISQDMACRLIVEQIHYLAPKGRPHIERWDLARRIILNCASYLKDDVLIQLAGQAAPDISQLKLKVREYSDHVSVLPFEKNEEITTLHTSVANAPRKPELPLDSVETEKVVRIEQGKIDVLMELIGELVIAKNAFPYMIQKLTHEYRLPTLARELKEKVATIDRITKELQDSILDVRMLPLSSVFSKFGRFVRDIARQSKKKIQLEIMGEETTLDKTLVEALSEPLIHLVRNAVDHGLETIEERRKMGKSEEGKLRLQAWREGNRVMIEVVDDGRGIEHERIRHRLRQLDLALEEEIEQLSHDELLEYIFHPGFSTAEEITALSGRGVGMDVVMTTIREMQGDVRLSSQPGMGTTVRIELPLTLTMTQILQIRVNDQVYGIPLDQIEETVKLHHSEIQRMQGQEMVLRRDRLIPIVHLYQYLGLKETTNKRLGTLYLVMLKNGISLQVDSFIGQQEVVVKPLDESLRHLSYLTGASIMGDGTVVLIINPHAIEA